MRRKAPWPARIVVLLLMAQEIYRVSLTWPGLDNRLVASTLVTVPSLAQPSWLIEIQVVAAR